jgi:multicomponent Na+:H+ antiporter subunit G
MADLLVAALFAAGAASILLAAVGVVRMPDLFLRMSCSTKASTLGVIACVLGAALHFGALGVAVRAAAGALFVLVTGPVAAQVIVRAAYLLGVPLWRGTITDQLRDRYDRNRGTLR